MNTKEYQTEKHIEVGSLRSPILDTRLMAHERTARLQQIMSCMGKENISSLSLSPFLNSEVNQTKNESNKN